MRPTRSLGLKLDVVQASTAPDLETAFATLAELRAGALVIVADAFFISRSEQLGALALRHAVTGGFSVPCVCHSGRLDELRHSYREL